MNIKVCIPGSDEAKALPQDAFLVDQVNPRPLDKQQSFCRVKGRRVGALVPACIPTPESQTPAALFVRLASCYEACIMAAVGAGAKTVVIKPLGVGQRRGEVYEDGQLVHWDTWGDLFWTHAKSSTAAKLGVSAVAAKDSTPDDLTVVFLVPKDFFDDWDSAMRF